LLADNRRVKGTQSISAGRATAQPRLPDSFDIRVETEADFCAHLDQVPDVVLCEYNLPQFNAMRALEVLNERRPEVPFLIVSGSISEETAVETMKCGAVGCLQR
jgi:DNA-binding NarL/FixJ family response regulator